MLFAVLCKFERVTSSSIKVDNLVHMVSRMSLHEEEENQHEMRTILAEVKAFAPADRIDRGVKIRFSGERNSVLLKASSGSRCAPRNFVLLVML